MLRRIVLVLCSPLIFTVGLGICSYIVLCDGFSSAIEYDGDKSPHPIRVALLIPIMVVASLITSRLFGTIGCIRDGNLDDITGFFKDIRSQ